MNAARDFPYHFASADEAPEAACDDNVINERPFFADSASNIAARRRNDLEAKTVENARRFKLRRCNVPVAKSEDAASTSTCGLGDGPEVIKIDIFDAKTTLAIDITHEYGLGPTTKLQA